VSLAGFLVDSTNHYAEVSNAEEAHYLVSVLNSGTLNEIIKPMQTRGLWGERDIYQLVWKAPTPRFDANDPAHQRLAELGRACHERVGQVATEVGQRYRSPARRRAAVRDLLKAELAEIDGLARRALGAG